MLFRSAIDSAIASTEMEGFKFTQSEKEDFDKIVNGTMTFEEHRQKYIEIGHALGEKGGNMDDNETEAGSDPYVYPGTNVLKNKFGIRIQEDLDLVERNLVTNRLAELILLSGK